MYYRKQPTPWLLAANALLLSAAQAAEIPFKVCSHDLPPHTMKLVDNQPGGLASEVLQGVAQRLGWRLDVVYQPWIRSRADAEAGRCDMIYTILDKPEYREFAVFPQQYLSDRYNVLVVRKDREIHYDGNLQKFMFAYSIGTYRDKAVSPLFDQLKHESWAKLDYANNPEDNMRKLLVGRFDAAIENSATAIYELRKLGALDKAEILSPPVYQAPAYVAFAKKGQALGHIDEFDRELKAFKATPAYNAIIARYQTP